MPEPNRSRLTDDQRARIVGGLLLLVFAAGIAVYQVLRGPYAFADDYLLALAQHRTAVVASVLLAFLGATCSVVVPALLLGVFERTSPVLAYLYLALGVVNFGAIAAENYSVLGLMEASLAYVQSGAADAGLEALAALRYQNHRWAHHAYLLISCLPVGVLYLALYRTRLVPKALASFGIAAAALMAVDLVFVFFGSGLGDFALVPIALVQLALPIWLLTRGFGGTRS